MIRIPTTAVKVASAVCVMAGAVLSAQQAPPAAATCTIHGTITGVGGPLPGVALTLRRGDTVQSAASTGVDGTFKLTLPDTSYQLTAELFGFDKTQKDVTVSKDACAQTVDLTMTLTPRVANAVPNAGPSSAPGAGRGGRGAGPRGGPAAANETAQAAAQRRFESLAVNENADTRSLDPSVFESAQTDPSSVTPLGFGSEALADAFAVTGQATRIDQGQLLQRLVQSNDL